MKSIKISTRILGTFGVLVLLLVVVVAMALLQLRSMRSSAETITGNALPSVEVLNAGGSAIRAVADTPGRGKKAL